VDNGERVLLRAPSVGRTEPRSAIKRWPAFAFFFGVSPPSWFYSRAAWDHSSPRPFPRDIEETELQDEELPAPASLGRKVSLAAHVLLLQCNPPGSIQVFRLEGAEGDGFFHFPPYRIPFLPGLGFLLK